MPNRARPRPASKHKLKVDSDLATFGRPPVTEVAVGVSFKYLEGLSIPLIGELWTERFSRHFPTVQEQPLYTPPVEQLDVRVAISSMSTQLGQAATMPRLWFVNKAGDELLQLQRNWFACNWRKVSPDGQYNRWPARRDAFRRWFSEFLTFVKDKKLGDVSPLQCEVTYVNHIGGTKGWKVPNEPDGFLRLSGRPQGRFLQSPEQTQLLTQFLITGDKGERLGRLHIALQPGITADKQEPIYVLSLTARGVPEGQGLDGILRFMDRGRRWIVKGFVDVITDTARKEWQLHE